MSGNGVVAPIANWRANVSSGFGPRRAPRTAGGRRGSSNHAGIDIAMPAGTPFKAAKAGTVVFAGKAGGYGNLAVIRHNDGTYTKYGHAQSLNVRPGQQVQAGQDIGKVGSTGNSSGPHLHFEVRQGDWRSGKAVDPRPLLEGASTSPTGQPTTGTQHQHAPGDGHDHAGETPGAGKPERTPEQRAKRRQRAGHGARRSSGKGGARRKGKGSRRKSKMGMPPAGQTQRAGQTQQAGQSQATQRTGQQPNDGTVPAGGSTNPQDLGAAQETGQQTTPDANSGKGFQELRAKLEKQGITGEFIKDMAQKYNVPEDMILGVIQQESGGNPKARSGAGAQGLMQLMPGTARSLGVKNPYDPKQNVEGGVKYLGQMLRMFNGNQQLALAAYNAGPGNVKKYKGIPPFRETQKYVKVIQANRASQTA